MKRILLSASLATSLLVAIAGPAVAATPNNQGCLGEDFSTYARFGAPGPVLVTDSGSGFGQFTAALAQLVPGMGLPVQTHQAGLISDAYVTNSCND